MTGHPSLGDDRPLELPRGVSVATWSHERTHWQNPRIRAFLGCIRLLGGVLESNYAILHCSPERLLEIWRKVREVTELMLTQLAPLLEQPSKIPTLEQARADAEVALTLLADTVLADLERFSHEVSPDEMLEVRKLLCVSIGKIHAFLQDTFGLLMASDPRSQNHDADYFLSRRFPQDVEEAEWLHVTVTKLHDFLRTLEQDRRRHLGHLIEQLRREQTLPLESDWAGTREFLQQLIDDLTPKLRSTLALRGIRFNEMEIIDRYTEETPTRCRVILELYATGRRATHEVKEGCPDGRPEREQNVRDLLVFHGELTRRMQRLMSELDRSLTDLVAFVPIWLDGISRRRALFLRRGASAHDVQL
ncbi:MAG: hypothetical protein AAGC60_12820 [Acidobacteriota bacterium]